MSVWVFLIIGRNCCLSGEGESKFIKLTFTYAVKGQNVTHFIWKCNVASEKLLETEVLSYGCRA